MVAYAGVKECSHPTVPDVEEAAEIYLRVAMVGIVMANGV